MFLQWLYSANNVSYFAVCSACNFKHKNNNLITVNLLLGHPVYIVARSFLFIPIPVREKV